MKWITLIVFSLYLLVGAFYNLYGDSGADIPITDFERAQRGLWHFSRDILIVVMAYLLACRESGVERKMFSVIFLYGVFNTIYDVLSVFGLAFSNDLIWSGFSVFVIFVLILIAFKDG